MICFREALWLFLIILIACNDNRESQPVTVPQPEFKASQIKLTNLSGELINPDQYNGKTLFINFWATWCKPCLLEMPSIQKAQEILNNENIVFLLASDETPDLIENFKNNHDYPFNYVRVENPEELNIMALPTTFIFNPEGKFVFSEMGYRKWDEKENLNLILKFAKSK